MQKIPVLLNEVRRLIEQKRHIFMLLSFQEDYSEATLYLIYGGEKKCYFGDVKVMPLANTLALLPQIISGNS